MSHLNALELRLSNERVRLSNSKTEKERQTRAVWVSQIEKEIAGEIAFLSKKDAVEVEMTDDELLAELMA